MNNRALGALALLLVTALAAGCGGTAAPTTAPPGTSGVGPSALAATPEPAGTPGAAGSPGTGPGASGIDLPTFDPGAILQNLEGIDSYRVTMSTEGEDSYAAVVVTKPVLSRDITIGSGEGAQHIVVIGDEAWQDSGAGFQPLPPGMATLMLAAFDPMLLAGGFANAGAWGGASDVGVEDKNGVRARHFHIDGTSFAGLASMPPGASVDAWIAEDGGYLVSLAIVGDGSGGFIIDITNVNDPANVVERPS